MSLSTTQNDEYIRKSGMQSAMTADRYKEEIGILFKEWKAEADTQGTAFITDGVMDPEKWFSQATRPLFLLKEAYGENSDWDLATDHVLLGRPITKDYKMWKRISLWSAGMLSSDYKLPHRYNPGNAEFSEFGNNHLHQIAVVNIKKYCGKKTSDNSEIEQFAIKDKRFLQREIELCDPTVIVCGYTANALLQVFDFGKRKSWNDEYYYHFELNGHEVLVLDYYHPANQYPEIMNYFTLMHIYDLAKMDQYRRLCDEICNKNG